MYHILNKCVGKQAGRRPGGQAGSRAGRQAGRQVGRKAERNAYRKGSTRPAPEASNFNFLKPTLEHIGPYRTIQDSNDAYQSTCDHSGCYQTMVLPINITDHHRGLCQTVRDNTDPYGPKQILKRPQGHTTPCRAIENHARPKKPIQDHMGPNWTVQDHMGSYRTLRDNTGRNRAIQDHTRPWGTIHDHTGPYGSLHDHAGPYGTIKVPYGSIWVHTDKINLSASE